MITCYNNEYFHVGDEVISLVYNSPSINIGTVGTIVNSWVGPLFAVIMPNGEFYKWLAAQDLYPVDPSQHTLRVGDSAIIKTDRKDSFNNPFLINGVVVRIIKIIGKTDYYGISVNDQKTNNAWLAGFDISTVF